MNMTHAPRHLLKAEMDRSPTLELLLGIVAFVFAPFIDAIEHLAAHPAATQIASILVVVSGTGGVLTGLFLAGTR